MWTSAEGAIVDVDVGGVGAMDVSRSEAQRADTNVIARIDDHASTTAYRPDVEATIRAVVAAGDYVRAKLRCAPFSTHIHRPYSRRYRVGCKVVGLNKHTLVNALKLKPFPPRCVGAAQLFEVDLPTTRFLLQTSYFCAKIKRIAVNTLVINA
jgi:hypothetical protein